MKNLIILIVGVFILSACKKSQNTTSIIGKWYLTRILYKADGGQVLLDSTFTNRNFYIQFNTNGTGSKTAWVFPDQTSGNFNYSLVNGHQITGTLAIGLSSLEVSTLSPEELILVSRKPTNGGVLETEAYYKR